jgi:hypothetical protein
MEFIYEKIWKDESGIWRGKQPNGTIDELAESWLNAYVLQLKGEVNLACSALRDIKKKCS